MLNNMLNNLKELEKNTDKDKMSVFNEYADLVSVDYVGNEYSENHHILPKSLGGVDADNLVRLKAQDHFLAHKLLSEFLCGEAKVKMQIAFAFMCRNKRKYEVSENDTKIANEINRKQMIELNSNPEFRAKQLISLKKLNKNEEFQKNRVSKLREKTEGENSYQFEGYYITPEGKFDTSEKAAIANNISYCAVIKRCKHISTRTTQDGKDSFKRDMLNSGWDFEYINRKPKRKHSADRYKPTKKYITPNGTFLRQIDAAESNKTSHETIRRKCHGICTTKNVETRKETLKRWTDEGWGIEYLEGDY